MRRLKDSAFQAGRRINTWSRGRIVPRSYSGERSWGYGGNEFKRQPRAAERDK